MNYILNGKIPIPCGDEDIWHAWFNKGNGHIGKYETERVTIAAEFIGKPLRQAVDNDVCEEGPLLFRVTAIFKDKAKPAEFSFYATWRKAEERFETYVQEYRASLN
jgi:hypothetical protein